MKQILSSIFIATGSHDTTLLAATDGCPLPACTPDTRN